MALARPARAGERRHVDDRSAATADHRRDRVLRAQIDTFEVHIYHALPHVLIQVYDGSISSIGQVDGRVAVEDVERAKSIDGAPHHRRNVARVRHTASDRDADATDITDQKRCLGEPFFVDVAHGNARARPSELDCRRLAHAARRARDERHFVLESHLSRYARYRANQESVSVQARTATDALYALGLASLLNA